MTATTSPAGSLLAGSRDLRAESSRWRRLTASLPMRLALGAVGGVWVLGCVWSFTEQTAFAASRGFGLPQLLPLVIDGFAIAMAGVAWAASLDARPAVAARAATLCAVAGSAGSNGAWAWLRAHHDAATVALAVAVPVAANIAFEVLLGELRRQVQRRRGLSAPAAIPYPRLIRILLAPSHTLIQWRSLVLELTTPQAPDGVASPYERGEATAPTRAGRPGVEQGIAALTRRPLPPVAAPTPPPDQVTTMALASRQRRTPPSPASDVPAPPVLFRGRRVDPRSVALAHRLAEMDAPEAVTGAMVTDLLATEITPRTGRRLLAQARAFRAASQDHPSGLAKAGAQG